MTTLAAPERHAAGAIWYFTSEEEREELIQRLKYWAGLWWAETLDTLAFIGGDFK